MSLNPQSKAYVVVLQLTHLSSLYLWIWEFIIHSYSGVLNLTIGFTHTYATHIVSRL